MNTVEILVVIIGSTLIGGFLYFLPTIYASKRRHKATASIALVNFFFGWTFIAWLACLVWAASDNVVKDAPQNTRAIGF